MAPHGFAIRSCQADADVRCMLERGCEAFRSRNINTGVATACFRKSKNTQDGILRRTNSDSLALSSSQTPSKANAQLSSQFSSSSSARTLATTMPPVHPPTIKPNTPLQVATLAQEIYSRKGTKLKCAEHGTFFQLLCTSHCEPEVRAWAADVDAARQGRAGGQQLQFTTSRERFVLRNHLYEQYKRIQLKACCGEIRGAVAV